MNIIVGSFKHYFFPAVVYVKKNE